MTGEALAPGALVLLLADARLPSGAHVHSGGVEQAVDDGVITDIETLEPFLAGRLMTGGRLAAHVAAMSCLWAAATPRPTAAAWRRMDEELSARILAPALCATSRRQGRSLLRTGLTMFGGPVLTSLVPDGGHDPHLAVVQGVLAGEARVAPFDAALVAAYAVVTTAATAALRLLGLDPVALMATVAGLAPQLDGKSEALRRAGGRAAIRRTSPRWSARSPTCWVSATPRERSVSLLREHEHPHVHGAADEHARVRTEGNPGHPLRTGRALRLGIGGPVGSGKTALVADLCRTLGGALDIAVVTNDIYTTEDADFLKAAAVLPMERIVAVETGCCPHTAIRDDIAANAEAVSDLERRFPALELVIIESGGDNLTATFQLRPHHRSPDLRGRCRRRRQAYLKGGPGVIRSDLLVVNKTDLAALVGADLGVMESDARRMRSDAPVLMVSVREGSGMGPVRRWVEQWVEHDRFA